MKLFFSVLAIVLLLFVGSAWGQPVPSWATGRNGSNQLQVNGGPLGTVTFPKEFAGTDASHSGPGGCTPEDRVAYDFQKDGYEGRPFGSCLTAGACPRENLDLTQPAWEWEALRHVLIKNWQIKNAFKTFVDPHVDTMQVYDAVGWGGWFVIQDSVVKNSDDGLVQFQFGATGDRGCATVDGKGRNELGGILLQGLSLDMEAAFVTDCQARPGRSAGSCAQGNNMGTWNPGELWMVDYATTNWWITMQQTWKKVVVVGSMPGLGERTGDAYSFEVQQACNPVTNDACSMSNKIFGPYPNIEAALADGHAEPPFIRLSCTGWANTANCTGGSTPLPPSAPGNFRTSLAQQAH